MYFKLQLNYFIVKSETFSKKKFYTSKKKCCEVNWVQVFSNFEMRTILQNLFQTSSTNACRRKSNLKNRQPKVKVTLNREHS